MMIMRPLQQGQGCEGVGGSPTSVVTPLVSGQLRHTASSGRGPWHLARSKALSVGLSNAYFNRSVSRPWPKRVSLTSRTAVYGPVRTVVWEGRSREAPPYPDLWHNPDQYPPATTENDRDSNSQRGASTARSRLLTNG